jgi:Flp pilus assembly pilin Flp
MKEVFRRLLRDEEGQDLIEYTLLMAFIALGSAAVFTHAGSSVNKVWNSAGTVLSNAVAVAAS